jgi:hypothetical protein
MPPACAKRSRSLDTEHEEDAERAQAGAPRGCRLRPPQFLFFVKSVDRGAVVSGDLRKILDYAFSLTG